MASCLVFILATFVSLSHLYLLNWTARQAEEFLLKSEKRSCTSSILSADTAATAFLETLGHHTKIKIKSYNVHLVHRHTWNGLLALTNLYRVTACRRIIQINALSISILYFWNKTCIYRDIFFSILFFFSQTSINESWTILIFLEMDHSICAFSTFHIDWKLKHLKVLQHAQEINDSWLAPITIERTARLCVFCYILLFLQHFSLEKKEK